MLILIFCQVAFGQLSWEQQNVEIHSVSEHGEAVANFNFKNAGQEAIKILAVTPSCSCTKVQASTNTVAPGEAGQIVAKMTVGDRGGKLEKIIVVETTDPMTPRTVLKFGVDIPVIARIQPSVLFWQPNEGRSPKVITLSSDYPVKNVSVSSSDSRVSAKVDPTNGGFKILVSPGNEQGPYSALLRITPDYPPENPKALIAHIRVN